MSKIVLRAGHHTGLHVSAIERSIRFYRDELGLRLLARRRAEDDFTSLIVGYPGAILEMAWLGLPDDSYVLELIEYVRPKGRRVDTATMNPGTGHVAFSVEDIDTAVASLRAAGIEVKSEPHLITAGKNSGARAVYLLDPDGMTVELIQPPI